jgi:dihydrofolate reductase
MKNYNIIMACDKHNGYAKNSNLPWQISEELKYFNAITTYKEGRLIPVVIMGRKTWDSLPKKPLKNRINIVLSKKLKRNVKDKHFVFDKFDDMLYFLTDNYFYNEKFIIGGESIIEEFLKRKPNLVSRIYLSYIQHNYRCNKFLKINDYLLNYNSILFQKRMYDKKLKKEVLIIFKKYKLKTDDSYDIDIFYTKKRNLKMFRIYKNERRDNLIVRLNLNEKIFSKIPEDPYNTLYHGKILI